MKKLFFNKTKNFFYISLFEFLLLIGLSVSLFITSFYLNNKNNSCVSDVSIYLDENNKNSLITTDIYAKKTYYCELYTFGDVKSADLKIVSNNDSVKFFDIKYFYNKTFYTYFYIDDYEGKIDIYFNCYKSKYVKTLNVINNDIETQALVDIDFHINCDTTPTVIENFNDYNDYIKNNEILKPYLKNVNNDFNQYFLFFNYIYITPSYQKFIYNSSFVYSDVLYIDYYAKLMREDIQFDISGIHFSVIRIDKKFLNFSPFKIRISYLDSL